MKTKKHKFVDLENQEKELLRKKKIIQTISGKVTTQYNYGFFIIYAFDKLKIYDHKNINLLQTIEMNLNFCFIISEKSFIICTEKSISKVYSKNSDKFEYIKSINFPTPTFNKIIPYNKDKIIFITDEGLQIWKTIDNIPSSCLLIIKLDIISFDFLDKLNLLVTNCYGEKICIFDMKNIKIIKTIKPSEERDERITAKKIDEEKILINKYISYEYVCNCIQCAMRKDYCEENELELIKSFREEHFNERIILKLPEFKEIPDFFDENNEEDVSVFVFEKKSIFIFYNGQGLFFYDIHSLQNIRTYYKFYFKEIFKASEDCLAVIKDDNYITQTIEFYEII